jgi:hypothetical protein
VDGAEIVINIMIWAFIMEGGLWVCSLQDVMGAFNNPCQFFAVCSCQILFISAQKYVTILTVLCV